MQEHKVDTAALRSPPSQKLNKLLDSTWCKFSRIIESWFGSVKTIRRGQQGSCTVGNSIAAAQMLHLKQSKSMGKALRDHGKLFLSVSGPLRNPRSGQNN